MTNKQKIKRLLHSLKSKGVDINLSTIYFVKYDGIYERYNSEIDVFKRLYEIWQSD